MIEIAILLILLTGPDGQKIEINPEEIVSIREPRGTEHFAKGTHCLIFPVDGKFIPVQETCDEVNKAIHDAKEMAIDAFRG